MITQDKDLLYGFLVCYMSLMGSLVLFIVIKRSLAALAKKVGEG